MPVAGSGRQTCAPLGLAERPTDVLLTYCAALELIDRDLDDADRVQLTELACRHLVAGSPFDLRAYYASLAERPAVQELAMVLRTDEQAAWGSAVSSAGAVRRASGADWSSRLEDARFARRITAAMDARGAFLAPALCAALDDVGLCRHHPPPCRRRPRSAAGPRAALNRKPL